MFLDASQQANQPRLGWWPAGVFWRQAASARAASSGGALSRQPPRSRLTTVASSLHHSQHRPQPRPACRRGVATAPPAARRGRRHTRWACRRHPRTRDGGVRAAGCPRGSQRPRRGAQTAGEPEQRYGAAGRAAASGIAATPPRQPPREPLHPPPHLPHRISLTPFPPPPSHPTGSTLQSRPLPHTHTQRASMAGGSGGRAQVRPPAQDDH